MSPKRIFQETPTGRLLAVRNWRHRERHEDALIAVPLEPHELERYKKLKEAGRPDEMIFDDLFGNPIDHHIRLPLEQLTKGQLLMLLRQITGADLSSMERSSQSDLVAMVRALCEKTEKCEAFLV